MTQSKTLTLSSDQTMSSVRLFYFDFPGRGELVRLVLAVAGVEFDDVRFSGADWAARYKPGKMYC